MFYIIIIYYYIMNILENRHFTVFSVNREKISIKATINEHNIVIGTRFYYI